MIKAFYKPKGISSYDLIRKLKSKFKGQKIGHGGTLDPLADGVLVIGIGKEGTRKLHDVLKGTDKTYEATIELGKVSETDDAEGPIVTTGPTAKPAKDTIHKALHSFEGKTEQIPPRYSAIKIDGIPAYKRARKGEQFTLPGKTVEVKQLKLLSYQYPILQVSITVSSGFYVRSFARDLGNLLGTGAYLVSLTRTAVGAYTLKDAEKLDETTPEQLQQR